MTLRAFSRFTPHKAWIVRATNHRRVLGDCARLTGHTLEGDERGVSRENEKERPKPLQGCNAPYFPLASRVSLVRLHVPTDPESRKSASCFCRRGMIGDTVSCPLLLGDGSRAGAASLQQRSHAAPSR